MGNGTKKCKRTKKGKPYYEGKFGRITVSLNHESELKVGFVYQDEVIPDIAGPPPAFLGAQPDMFGPEQDERLIASVSEEIWQDYLQNRYDMEAKAGLGSLEVVLKDGKTIPSHHQEANKSTRVRHFFTLAANHPHDLEIRQEIRDGQKIVMIKKGNGAHVGDPVIHRQEIKLVCHVDEPIEIILAKLPDEYKEMLELKFDEKSEVSSTLETNSMRQKSKVKTTLEYKGQMLDIYVEPARDIGSGTIKGTEKRWPIREFEAEVKGIYLVGSDIDIKDDPEIVGWTQDDIKQIAIEVLGCEQKLFIESAWNYLERAAGESSARYGHITVQPIFDSKSKPGLKIQEEIMAEDPELWAKVLDAAACGGTVSHEEPVFKAA